MSFMLFLSILMNIALFIALLSARAQAYYHQQRVFDMQNMIMRTTVSQGGSGGFLLALAILGSLFFFS
jgi:hypothetical protein